MHIVYLHSLSSSQHIHMVGLYSSLRPLTYKAPVGIQFCCNHDGWIQPPPQKQHSPPLKAFIIIVTLGPRFGPFGPQTFPRRASLGSGPQLQLVHFHCDGCMYEYCGISACVLIMLSDCVRQLTAMFSLNKPDFKCWKSSQCTL